MKEETIFKAFSDKALRETLISRYCRMKKIYLTLFLALIAWAIYDYFSVTKDLGFIIYFIILSGAALWHYSNQYKLLKAIQSKLEQDDF